jgi:hypothetical protein
MFILCAKKKKTQFFFPFSVIEQCGKSPTVLFVLLQIGEDIFDVCRVGVSGVWKIDRVIVAEERLTPVDCIREDDVRCSLQSGLVEADEL